MVRNSPVIVEKSVPVVCKNIAVVYARTHDRKPSRIAITSKKISEGVTGESEEEHLAAGVEVESLVQLVMFVLHAELQTVAAFLPAQVTGSVGLLDSTVVGKGAGAQIEVVGHRDFRHACEQIAERRCDSQLGSSEWLLRLGTCGDDAVAKVGVFTTWEVRTSVSSSESTR